LRCRSTFKPCLTDQTSDTGCCISGSASRSISDSRLRPTFPPGLRTQPPIPRRLHPFGAAFRPTCGLRRRSTFRPCLTDPTSDSSALHLWRRFRPILDSRLRSTFGYLQANLQLALATNPPAEPSCQSPACAFDQPSGCLPI
jgi:hypothetical protein